MYYNYVAGQEMLHSKFQLRFTVLLQARDAPIRMSALSYSSVAGQEMLLSKYQLCLTGVLQGKKRSNQNVSCELQLCCRARNVPIRIQAEYNGSDAGQEMLCCMARNAQSE